LVFSIRNCVLYLLFIWGECVLPYNRIFHSLFLCSCNLNSSFPMN
jgi:hypothetical protein